MCVIRTIVVRPTIIVMFRVLLDTPSIILVTSLVSDYYHRHHVYAHSYVYVDYVLLCYHYYSQSRASLCNYHCSPGYYAHAC